MNVQRKPLAILTDDYPRAFRDVMSRHSTDEIMEYHIQRRELKTKDTWYVFFTSADRLRGWVIGKFETMIYHPTNRTSRRDMAEMIIVAQTRVR